jgi:hypothetical protein
MSGESPRGLFHARLYLQPLPGNWRKQDASAKSSLFTGLRKNGRGKQAWHDFVIIKLTCPSTQSESWMMNDQMMINTSKQRSEC